EDFVVVGARNWAPTEGRGRRTERRDVTRVARQRRGVPRRRKPGDGRGSRASVGYDRFELERAGGTDRESVALRLCLPALEGLAWRVVGFDDSRSGVVVRRDLVVV